MPRDGSGHGDNAPELGKEMEHNITHGAGTEQVSILFSFFPPPSSPLPSPLVPSPPRLTR